MDNNQTFLNACRNGQKSIVQIFLKKGGIDINKRDQEGNTALYYACQKGYRDIVALLLDNDADASCINNRSESPLHAAARSGNKEILGKLLQKGADINVTDNEGRTPLICLLDNKRTDAALFLMASHPALFLFPFKLPFEESFLTIAKAILFNKEKLTAAFFFFLVASSLNVTSNCQWRLFSIDQWVRIAFAIFCISNPMDEM